MLRCLLDGFLVTGIVREHFLNIIIHFFKMISSSHHWFSRDSSRMTASPSKSQSPMCQWRRCALSTYINTGDMKRGEDVWQAPLKCDVSARKLVRRVEMVVLHSPVGEVFKCDPRHRQSRTENWEYSEKTLSHLSITSASRKHDVALHPTASRRWQTETRGSTRKHKMLCTRGNLSHVFSH